MATAGYSNTGLAKKLGIKPGFSLLVQNEPPNYFDLLADFPEAKNLINSTQQKKDMVHHFTSSVNKLKTDMPRLKNMIHQNGMIWISWPKKASHMKTDLTEDLIRTIAIQNGLVDVKVCAIDETWSGLKLVIPLKDRK